MTGFVDLMGNDVWSEADIKARLHAMIRARFSEQVEAELSRAVMGAMLGQHQITPQEGAAIAAFKALTDEVAVVGVQARSDWALLQQVFAVEAAQRRLSVPEPEVPEVPNAQDEAERAQAQSLIDAASPEVVALVQARAELATSEPATPPSEPL